MPLIHLDNVPMNKSITELENLLTQQFQVIIDLKNEVEKKTIEKHDQLKDLSLGIMDVIDSFERAEEGLKGKALDQSEEVSKFASRYKTIQKKLVNLLAKYGITRIDFPDNRLIVGLCEVVDTVPDSARQNDEIVSIIRNGYIRGSELIREAQIIVVKN